MHMLEHVPLGLRRAKQAKKPRDWFYSLMAAGMGGVILVLWVLT